MQIILVNPHARRLRGQPRFVRRIERLASGRAKVMVPRSAEAAVQMLEETHFHAGITEVFVVGGDGTFNLVLNWVLSLPEHKRPAIMPVGGGQICYMSRFLGLRSRHPIKNLRRVLSRNDRLERVSWHPLAIKEHSTGQVRYAAVFATGIVHRFIKWYEDLGKGSMLVVALMVLACIPITLSDRIRRWHGRLEGSEGELTLGGMRVPSRTYTGLVVSTIPVMIPWCWPFHGDAFGVEFYCVAYWGSLRRLAAALPWVWRGKIAPFAEGLFFNWPVSEVRLKTNDPDYIADGDTVTFRGTQEAKEWEYSLEVRLGPSVQLLRDRSS